MKNIINPENYSNVSNVKVWWVCSQNSSHRWETLIYNRTLNSSECPYCYAPSENYNLSINNLELAAEWNYDKNTLIPKRYAAYSHSKVWWKVIIYNRNEKNNTDCPVCVPNGYSKL
jgi:uncharacterized Zn-finger protein